MSRQREPALSKVLMPLTLLFDLDDTLLDTNMAAFLPAYYGALAQHLSNLVPPEAMMPALVAGVKMMLENSNPTLTLQEVFEADFYPRLGMPKERLSQAINDFYDNVFPSLRSKTQPRAGARELVEWTLDQGHQVAIATDPLFPQKATFERVRWAGLEPGRFDLISSFESFHFTKSRPTYYAEMIGRLGWPERPIVMVGDSVERDLAPAQVLGLTTYHVNYSAGHRTAPASRTGESRPLMGEGDLLELRAWLEAARLEVYSPTFKTTDSIRAALEATPAVLEGLTANLSESTWAQEPSSEDWAMIELVCHLRDTEREVHHAQLKMLLEGKDPFVPRPDAAVWAKQRKYLSENGRAAVREFAAARISTLDQLTNLAPEVWAKKARHAIFGPTNFMEVVGFIADHDRMHLQQAWNTLARLSEPAHRN